MKKGLFLGILGFVLILFFMHLLSSENSTANNLNLTNSSGDILKSGFDAIRDSNNYLDQPIQLAPELRGFLKVFFRLDQGFSLSFKQLAIFIFLFAMLFVIIFIIIKMIIPSSIKSFLVSIIITCLISISGAISEITKYLYTPRFFIFFGILILVLAVLFVILSSMKKRVEAENAQRAGERAGASARILGDSLDELSGRSER